MKMSKASYLSRQELSLFERLYQNVESWPGIKEEGGFKMQNLLTPRTREYHALYSQAPGEIMPQRNRTKLGVASHEAGHAVVMAACHGQIEAAKIHMDGVKVKGGVVIPINVNTPTEVIEDAPLPPWNSIASNMLVDMAGFVAEHLYHGEHSYAHHEKLTTYCQCRFLDERKSYEPLRHWGVFTDWCIHLLEVNRPLFNVVVGDLLENLTMTPEVKDRLHNEVKKESIELFFPQ